MDLLIELLPARLWATSLQSILLVALVWIVCRSMKRLPAATQCWLWWLVALQTTLGLLWASPLQLPLLPAPDTVQTVIAAATVDSETAVAMPFITVDPVTGSTLSWSTWMLVAWLAGVLVMTLRTLLAWRASRQLLRSSQPCGDAQLIAALRMAAEAHGLRHPPQLRTSAQITSPQLIGPWNPVVLLPARRLPSMADDDLDMALTHELVHLRRRDLWWGLLPALAQHLFFFHPLVHLAAREYAVAREAAVDAAVVAGNRHCRHDYGRLLLQLGVSARPTSGLASASPTFLSLKRRLLMLQDTGSFSRIGALLILVAVAVVGVAPMRLVAMPAPPTPPTPPPPPAAPAMPPAIPAVFSGDGRSVVVPAAPVAPAVLPAAPAAAPAPPVPVAATEALATQGMLHLSSDSSRDGYVLLKYGINIMDGSMADLRQAQHLDDGNGVLLLRQAGKQYLVRDAATLLQLQQLYAETTHLAEAQTKLGEQQGQLGQRQSDIGARAGEMAARLGVAAAHRAQLALSAGEGDMTLSKAAALREAERVRADMNSSGMREEMRTLARQQAELGKRQAELGREQANASARARQQAERVIEQAIREGIAKPFKG